MVGACFSLAYVAAGRLDAYWERQAHPWDVAAGALLVREAGGHVTGGAGPPLDGDEPPIVAANGGVHAPILTLPNGPPAARGGRADVCRRPSRPTPGPGSKGELGTE